ncbi:MAG: hypothetical protein IT361_04625 [Gemmatimonadaceae bacterium]|nr:hypothetical protein [Gemmatimonadaceae bacterium]
MNEYTGGAAAYPARGDAPASVILAPAGSPLVSTLWRVAQLGGVALTLVLLGGLLTYPTQTLHVLWDMVVPVLPAVFLVNPMIWRNVCPLATLNALPGQRLGSRLPGPGASRAAWTLGIVLLFVMVPARRFLFNTHGDLLALTIAAVAVLALVGGIVFSRRSGFCNAVCPVLPVEKLYGQFPLAKVDTDRCRTCTLCVPVGCIDLAGTKTVAQTVGPARRQRGWLATAFGIFAAAFPGFIVAYFTLENGPIDTAWSVYAHVALYSVISYALVAGLALVGKLSATTLLPILGGASFMLYYWYSAPTLGAAYGAPDAGAVFIRLGAAVLTSIWLMRALRRSA